ncbi:MAG: MFS transporter [Betaproteobacteria bacterium]|nr:MFS transporter [Betaproteobacteria bacterium]
MDLPQSLRALRSPNFRRYYAGQAVSMIGTWMQSIALMWLAYKLTGSTVFTGLVGFLNSVPYLVLSPVAGVVGDRFDRRRILMTVLTLMGLQALALTVLSGFGLITPALLATLALVGGLANSFETPTRQAFFVQILDNREDLPNAIALNSILMNGARFVGPSLGGIAIAAAGETFCFAVNAVSYLAVLAALRGTRTVNPPPERGETHVLADLADGWRHAMGFYPIRRMLLVLATVSITIGPYSSLMPAIAVKTFSQGAGLVGFFIGCVGLGAVIAATSLARRPSVRGLAKWIPIALVLAGTGAIGFCFSRSVWLSAVFLVLAGFGMFLTSSTCNTIIQSVIDDDKRGRVMSYYTMFFIGSLPVGHLGAGWLAEHIGAPRTFLAGGIACALAGCAFAAALPSFREGLRPLYVRRGIIPASRDAPR